MVNRFNVQNVLALDMYTRISIRNLKDLKKINATMIRPFLYNTYVFPFYNASLYEPLEKQKRSILC